MTHIHIHSRISNLNQSGPIHQIPKATKFKSCVME